MTPADAVASFHELYYGIGDRGGTWKDTYWLGVPTRKCPLDLWIMQELLHEVRPDLIVECGTAFGGSALFLASLCDLLRRGQVVTIDVAASPQRPRHPRIDYVTGSSIDPAIVREVASRAAGRTTLVVLDSDHAMSHVLAELRAYAPLVSPGSYVVVEDTNVNGHPVLPGFGPGPMEAVDAFLAEDARFAPDREREKLLLSFNPRGFLRRARP